ncbi:MAG: hypothetical protein E7378_00220 [Clostridiales bacterium]|nr:hypothetical protein [Clostridiales bacterium]
MQNFIGEKLEKVIEYFNNNGIKFNIKDNNFSVAGDTKLVTNITTDQEKTVITTGDFIFDIRNKNNENK